MIAETKKAFLYAKKIINVIAPQQPVELATKDQVRMH